MVRNPDHITVAVRDADAAIAFFALLGFRRDHTALIDGGEPAEYMGMPGMVADHITLVLEDADPRFEIQLLHFRSPEPGNDDESPSSLNRLGFNHLAFRVDDVAATAAHLEANGVARLNAEMDYISRKLEFFAGPEGVTIELVEWIGE